MVVTLDARDELVVVRVPPTVVMEEASDELLFMTLL